MQGWTVDSLDAHYDNHPSDRPDPVEVAQFLAEARRLGQAQRDDLVDALRAMHEAMDPAVDPETLLAATAAHLAISGSAA